MYYDLSYVYKCVNTMSVTFRAYSRVSLSKQFDSFLIEEARYFFRNYPNIKFKFYKNISEICPAICGNRDVEFNIDEILLEQEYLIYEFLYMININFYIVIKWICVKSTIVYTLLMVIVMVKP